jgi:hypothetical protein
MNLNTANGATAPMYSRTADLAALLSAFEALVDEIVSSCLSRDALALALETSTTEVTSVLRCRAGFRGQAAGAWHRPDRRLQS